MVPGLSKRKFDDCEEPSYEAFAPAKHTKVAPTTDAIITEDVDMGGMDDAPSPAPSLASLATSASSQGSPAYPHFDLYPFPSFGGDADMMDTSTDPRKAFASSHSRSDSSIGLLQPQSISGDFVHHGFLVFAWLHTPVSTVAAAYGVTASNVVLSKWYQHNDLNNLCQPSPFDDNMPTPSPFVSYFDFQLSVST
ncbi:hypothetical protein RhiJN_24637 [Ceratobasidium sp. AG-Ba]|nr:hypothetical protein RhiJN_24637 [Ceratobasidium sp. AG-Ba]